HPSTLVGVPVMFYSKPSVPPRGGSTLGYDSVALAGSSFRSPAARQIPDYRAAGEASFKGAFRKTLDLSALASLRKKIFKTRVQRI
ncbi:MAG: hypothetical protein J6J97_08960, partial [Akkermansia sp.]|nr:hypothetical protein [Akkermansia sp.]